MKVKIKALRDDPCGGYSIGDVFMATVDSDGCYLYCDLDGDNRMTISEAFEVISDHAESGESRVVIYADQFTTNEDVAKEWVEQMTEHSKTCTTPIEVGSEWVGNEVVDGEGVVKYVSDKSILIDIVNKGEQFWSHSQFSRTFKPKQKTVTMYFYKDCKGLVHSYSEIMPVFGDYLFTKEIEL